MTNTNKNIEVLAMEAEAAGDFVAAYELYQKLSWKFGGSLGQHYKRKRYECAMRIETLRKGEELASHKWNSFLNPKKLTLVVNNG